jgi:hypothetical protein
MIRTDFFQSHVADVDEAVNRVDAAADVDTFARELAGLIENASSRITVPVMVEGDQLVVRTEQGLYRLSIARDHR